MLCTIYKLSQQDGTGSFVPLVPNVPNVPPPARRIKKGYLIEIPFSIILTYLITLLQL